MKIVYQEKERRSDFIRNLKPTDVCYINNTLYMIVRRVIPNKMEVIQLCTGICEYLDDSISVEPVDTAVVLYD
jgi:hypothetical protein